MPFILQAYIYCAWILAFLTSNTRIAFQLFEYQLHKESGGHACCLHLSCAVFVCHVMLNTA